MTPPSPGPYLISPTPTGGCWSGLGKEPCPKFAVAFYTSVEDGRHDMLSFISDQMSMASPTSQLRLRRALVVLLGIFLVFYCLWPSRRENAIVVTSASAGARTGGSSGGVPRPEKAPRPQQAWTEQDLHEWDNLDLIKNETLGVCMLFLHINCLIANWETI